MVRYRVSGFRFGKMKNKSITVGKQVPVKKLFSEFSRINFNIRKFNYRLIQFYLRTNNLKLLGHVLCTLYFFGDPIPSDHFPVDIYGGIYE